MDSGITGYGANDYVKKNYGVLKQLIATMKEGELVDLIGCVQVELGVKEDKAREYVFGAISKHWIEISNDSHQMDTLQAKKSLKHLLPAHFAFNVDETQSGILQETQEERCRRFERTHGLKPNPSTLPTKPETVNNVELDARSETPFTDWTEKRELEKAREKLRSLK